MIVDVLVFEVEYPTQLVYRMDVLGISYQHHLPAFSQLRRGRLPAQPDAAEHLYMLHGAPASLTSTTQFVGYICLLISEVIKVPRWSSAKHNVLGSTARSGEVLLRLFHFEFLSSSSESRFLDGNRLAPYYPSGIPGVVLYYHQ